MLNQNIQISIVLFIFIFLIFVLFRLLFTMPCFFLLSLLLLFASSLSIFFVFVLSFLLFGEGSGRRGKVRDRYRDGVEGGKYRRGDMAKMIDDRRDMSEERGDGRGEKDRGE